MSKITNKAAKAPEKKKQSVADKLSEVTKKDPAPPSKVTPKKPPVAKNPPAKKGNKPATAAKEDQAPPPKGHNKPPADEKPINVDGIAGKQLKQFIIAVERIDADKRELDEDKKDIFTHAKDTGFDVRTMRKVIALRKQDKGDRDAAQDLVNTYMFALGDR